METTSKQVRVKKKGEEEKSISIPGNVHFGKGKVGGKKVPATGANKMIESGYLKSFQS